MKEYSLGIIGFGGMANWHRELLNEGAWWDGKLSGQKIENLKATGSFDIDEKKQKLAVERGLKAYGTRKELLADPNIDIILVTTPNDFHMPLVVEALEAGKNVVCEKPAALNSSEFQKMTDAAQKTERFLPFTRTAAGMKIT